MLFGLPSPENLGNPTNIIHLNASLLSHFAKCVIAKWQTHAILISEVAKEITGPIWACVEQLPHPIPVSFLLWYNSRRRKTMTDWISRVEAPVICEPIKTAACVARARSVRTPPIDIPGIHPYMLYQVRRKTALAVSCIW